MNVETNDKLHSDNILRYDENEALLIARYMNEANYATENGMSFSQQYLLHKGLLKFKEKGEAAALKEAKQLHDRKCFEPISVAELNPTERHRAMEALMYLTEKRDGTIKGRQVYNGKPTREWLNRDEAASPTASLEGIMLTSVIDAKENRDIMTADIPNAFIQAPLPLEEGDERIIMKITGPLVDILLKLNTETYGPYVVYEKSRKVVYVRVLRGIYGMLQAALLWYSKFRKDLEEIGFIFNPYDPCIANKMINDKQHTIRFHVDDLLSSHEDPKVNDEFLKWLESKYGGSSGSVKAIRGKEHDYLGMILEYDNEKLKINMSAYVENMLEEFPISSRREIRVQAQLQPICLQWMTVSNLTRTNKNSFIGWWQKAYLLVNEADRTFNQSLQH